LRQGLAQDSFGRFGLERSIIVQNIVNESVRDGKQHWGWYMAVGVALIVVGVLAIFSEAAATFASITVLGAFIFIAGIMQIAGAFATRGAGHVILLLLVGVLDIIVGLMLWQHPVAGALTITLLLAALLVFGGIFRFVSALWLRFPQYGMAAVSGVITFILGVLLWAQWPSSGLWFIGFAVGLNFIFVGLAWSSMALKLKAA
jgi:uncharacterized membrane protein HdeD (DUF308 family)